MICDVFLRIYVSGELLNEDQLRDISNYANNRRSKRALCGAVRSKSALPAAATTADIIHYATKCCSLIVWIFVEKKCCQ